MTTCASKHKDLQKDNSAHTCKRDPCDLFVHTFTTAVSLTVVQCSCSSSYPVVSEVVSLRQLPDARVELEVVENVDAFDVTEAVVQDACELKQSRTLRLTTPHL